MQVYGVGVGVGVGDSRGSGDGGKTGCGLRAVR